MNAEDEPTQAGSAFIAPATIERSRQRLAAGDARGLAAWTALRTLADSVLSRTPSAVEDYDVPGYYGDQRDEHTRMKRLLDGDMSAAFACAALSVVGHDLAEEVCSRYRQQALRIVRDWAQVNRTVSGYDGKLVMCYNGTALVVTAGLLRLSAEWTADDEQAMQQWIRRVLLPAASIKKRDNNWGAWGIFASINAHAYVQDVQGLASDEQRLREIIDSQIEPDGSMPHEIKRGKRGIWYTYFALAPLTAAVETLRGAGGPDLYRLQPASGGSIEEGLAFLYAKGLVDPQQWPEKQARTQTPDWDEKHGALFLAMGTVFQKPAWIESALPPSLRLQGGLAWMTSPLFLPEPAELK